MPSHFAAPLMVIATILASTGSVRAQRPPPRVQAPRSEVPKAQAAIAQAAIVQLGNASPKARAKARKMILDLGKSGLDSLRRAIAAGEDITPEQLFVLAEDIGRERRNLQLAQTWELAEKSWRVAWRPDGQRLGLLQKYGGTVTMLDADLKQTGDRFGGDAAKFAFDPTDQTFAYNNGDGKLLIAERKTGRLTHLVVTGKPSLAYSPDGRHLATGGYGHDVTMWRVADGTRVATFSVDGSKGALHPLFSPNGKLLVIGNRNDTTSIFDVDSGKLLQELERKSSHQPVFSPDGTRLAIAYVDGKIGIWNPTNGTLEKLLDSDAEEVFTLAWSPDGTLLASAGLAGPIVIWSGRHLAKLHTLEPGSDRIFRLAFRPDGKLLVAAGNKTTRAWSIKSKL